MRESTQSHITFILYEGKAIRGDVLIQAINVAQTNHGFRGAFYLLWVTHYLSSKKCKRVRLLRRLKSGGTGDPKQSYGFFLTLSYMLCRPLVIDPEKMYDCIYLVVDSWGENFKQQMQRPDSEDFLERCYEQGEKLNKAIQDTLKAHATN